MHFFSSRYMPSVRDKLNLLPVCVILMLNRFIIAVTFRSDTKSYVYIVLCGSEMR